MHVEWLTKLRRHGSTDQLQLQSREVSIMQGGAKVQVWLAYDTDVLRPLQAGQRPFGLILRQPLAFP